LWLKPYAVRNQKLGIVASTAALVAHGLFMPILTSGQQTATTPREVWIAVRTDGKAGTGTISNPYDGSTQAKFDARMASFGPKTQIHLGRGTFQTAWNHLWKVKDGWRVSGTGMYSTTVQIVGRLTGHPGTGAAAFVTGYNRGADSAVLKDFTIDCNWSGLANSADTGATVRTFTNTSTVTDSPTIASTNGVFTQLDVGRVISGEGIPANSWIGIVNSANAIGLSSSGISNMPVNATVSKGTRITIAEKNCKVFGAYIYGASNCKYDHIRVIHGYGTGANSQEAFMLGFAASYATSGPRNHDAANNVISYCLVEKCFGNYGNPFALHGSASDYKNNPNSHNIIRDSRVEFCTAYGEQGPFGYQTWNGFSRVPLPGSVSPFTPGGVNLADAKNITIRGNHFVDCQTIAYQDTGGFDGVEVSRNTLVRGWTGINFVVNPSSFSDKQFHHVKITHNRIGIQRRTLGGANYAIIIRNDCEPIIDGNTITYDMTGPGNNVFWPLQVLGTKGTIVDNIIEYTECVRIGDAGVTNGAPDPRYILYNNRTVSGAAIAGMADTAVIERVVIPWIRTIGRIKLPLSSKPTESSAP
jgi:hypothetical protein